MTQSEKIEFTAGRVHALVGFVTAVAYSHPDPVKLAAAWEQVGLANLAMAESQPVDEAYIEGVQDMQQRIQALVALALKEPMRRRK